MPTDYASMHAYITSNLIFNINHAQSKLPRFKSLLR